MHAHDAARVLGVDTIIGVGLKSWQIMQLVEHWAGGDGNTEIHPTYSEFVDVLVRQIVEDMLTVAAGGAFSDAPCRILLGNCKRSVYGTGHAVTVAYSISRYGDDPPVDEDSYFEGE